MEKNQIKTPEEICFEIIENKNNYELLKKYLIGALQNIINKDYYTVVNITGRIRIGFLKIMIVYKKRRI